MDPATPRPRDPATAVCPLLSLRGIRKSFGGTAALRGVDLDLHARECVALIGENGAGKSTLMKVLSGVYQPDGGTMLLDGQHFTPKDPLAARRAGVAIVHQELAIAAHLSVAENIVLGTEPVMCGLVHARQRDAVARRALAELGADLPLGRLASALAPAERQLVEIARTLVTRPRILVLDEPTSSLGREDAARLHAAVGRLVAGGVAVIWISHHLEECRLVASRCLVLRDGASVADGAMAAFTDAELIRQLAGRAVDELYPRQAHRPGAPLLELQALAGVALPVAASLTVCSGEVVGIFGLVGAGRTELLRVVLGLDRRRAGTVTFAGAPAPENPAAWLAAGVGLLSEDRKGDGLLLARSIADNATLTNLRPCSRGGLVSPRRQQAAAAALMTRATVKAAGPEQAVGELSGGNQQKVAFARLLHHDCRLLLLDEPTRGIDVGAKAALYQLIDDLAVQGRAVLVVSSYLPELLGICDRIAVMTHGRLGPARPVAQCHAEGLIAEAIGTTEQASS